MAVRFVIGRSGTGKSTLFLREIVDQLKEEPMGDPIIYLVPDQMTFLSEYQLVKSPEIAGMIRAQVYSFSRLAWRILQQTGGINRYHLTSTGLNMLIRKIIEDKKDELKLFRQAADQSGFVQQVETMLTEFRRYCVQPEELFVKKETLSENKNHSLADKLHDLHKIYEEFEQRLVNKYIDSEDYFRLLAESIEQSEELQRADIYIDGFHSFTPQEYLVIQQLMKTCRRVSIALTVDQPYTAEPPHDLHLFRMTGETYQTLYTMAIQEGIRVEEPVILTSPKRFRQEELQHLESQFEHRPTVPYEKVVNGIRVIQGANRRAEIEAVAREIRALVSQHGYRYQDIALLIRNGNVYQDLLETIFFDYDIPYFIDQKRPMHTHPLIELLRSTLETIQSHWRYEPIFRAVKTDLLFPLQSNKKELREKMDRLENYVLAYGIKGEQWTSRKRWIYRRFRGIEEVPQTDEEKKIEHELNELRLFITAPILRLARRLKKATTVRDKCASLYLYLEELDIPAKLEKMSFEATERGDLVKSREHQQAWDAVIDLLDQFVEILGSDEMSLKKFITVLDAGLESMRFSLVPPAMDQVLVANMEQSRLSHVKVAFVIGLNDGVLPAKLDDDGILQDEDREWLLTNGLKIAPSSKMKLLDEEFIAYTAFTTPEERLYISYPLADEEGRALLPSPYLKKFHEMFPQLEEQVVVNDPSELRSEDQLSYVSHPNTAIAYLTSQLQLKKRNYPMADFWWDVYNYYVTTTNWKEKATHILSSLFYQNRPKRLSEETSKSLYGDTILASVSRMERFHSCPFAHFATYGLKLKEREIYRLEAPDIGEMFHGALKWIAEEINRQNLSWKQLTKEQCADMARQAIAFLAPKLQHQILLSSNRHHYIKRKLEQIVSKASYVLSEHAKASGFAPIGLELGFGRNEPLPPFSFTLKNGTKMELTGRIDRVDKAENGDNIYLRIIDYKSSAKEIDLTEVYYGLALQMLTYLDIVVSHSEELIGKQALPAGVLYFHVHNPMVKTNKWLSDEELERELFKRFKMNGLVVNDTDAIRLMDETIEAGDSHIVPVRLNKNGTVSDYFSKAASKEDFYHLRQFVRRLYQKAGNQIVSGVTDLSPYKLKDRTPCQYCSFKQVCQFDQAFEENNYRILVPKKKNEMMEVIREEVLGNGPAEHSD
jgi:ATP-dependent helicase/nuclease subunit B